MEQYTLALEVCRGIDRGDDGEVSSLVCTLRLNMSLACGKCMKWELAVGHAEAVLDGFDASGGSWTMSAPSAQHRQKAYWRRGEALMGLKRPERAVHDFVRVYAIEQDMGQRQAYRGKVEAVIRVLGGMPERLAGVMCGLVDEVICGFMVETESSGVLRVVEEMDEMTRNEAAYLVVKEMESDGARDALESARETCSRWLLHMPGVHGEIVDTKGAHESLGIEEALVWRSRVCCKAKAYEQAREDALGALRLLEANSGQWDVSTLVYRRMVMSGYVALGKALYAESGYSGRDGPRALKALRKAVLCVGSADTAVNVMGNLQGLYDLVHEVTEGLTKEEVDAVEREVGAEGTVLDRVDAVGSGRYAGEGAKSGCAMERAMDINTMAGDCGVNESEELEMLEVKLGFCTTTPLTPFCREQLRKLVACSAQVRVGKVGIQGVRVHGDGLEVRLRVETGAGVGVVRDGVLGSFAEPASNDVGDQNGVESLDLHRLKGALGEIAGVDVDKVECDPARQDGTTTPVAPVQAVVKAAKPELQLALPYKDYKLVDSVGRQVERGQRHAFCMSRVYYDRSEMESTETWIQLADGSCRWRQSGSEIKIIALRVPSDLAPKMIDVKFEPYELRVMNKGTGDVYLSGKLHRGIIPSDCFWTHLGGEGEDALLITMTKMNLEVLQKHWMHSEMWWSRLFEDHPECQWDDYSKDYSDLPEEVMERHRIREAQKEETRALESKDEKRRKRLTGEEERRKRNRMNRLSVLREGAM